MDTVHLETNHYLAIKTFSAIYETPILMKVVIITTH
jgi:hypothetical protein